MCRRANAFSGWMTLLQPQQFKRTVFKISPLENSKFSFFVAIIFLYQFWSPHIKLLPIYIKTIWFWYISYTQDTRDHWHGDDGRKLTKSSEVLRSNFRRHTFSIIDLIYDFTTYGANIFLNGFSRVHSTSLQWQRYIGMKFIKKGIKTFRLFNLLNNGNFPIVKKRIKLNEKPLGVDCE